MHVSFGPLDVYFPTPSDGHFWFAHDLADLMGVEYNADAAEQLRAMLTETEASSGVDIDQEADSVLVNTTDAGTMATVLEALRTLARQPLFSDQELADALRVMNKWRRPKKTKYDVDDLFAVPLNNGDFGVIHVAAFPDADGKRFRGSPLLLLLDIGGRSLDDLRRRVTDNAGVPAGALITNDADLVDGAWPFVGHRPARYDGVDVDALADREKGRSSGWLHFFLPACLGLDAWDNFQPVMNDRYLVPGYQPTRRIYRRRIFELRLQEVFAGKPTIVERGPTTAHILIAYPGSGPPRPFDADTRLSRLASALRETLGPAVHDTMAGGGIDGFLDLFLQAPDAEVLQAALEAESAQLNLADDVLMTCYAPFDLDWQGVLVRQGTVSS